MTRIGRWILGLCVALLALGGALAADPVTLEGEFVWQRSDGNRNGDVKAVFTPAEDGAWTVAFHFEWEDGPHVFTGTARGSLKAGDLEGEVETDNEEHKATFRFSGTFTDGTFTGTHGVVQEDGSLRDTGTLSLGPAS